ncbi:hypothetical protein ABET14_02860 [Heyndrickxia coagulans]
MKWIYEVPSFTINRYERKKGRTASQNVLQKGIQQQNSPELFEKLGAVF